ncbi:MAG: Mce-associated rane protein [Chloroflexota bacterium]|jgi:Mce-associated membrane protein|nr:Mce-associated rane protein [Chloroflexota bacterium]
MSFDVDAETAAPVTPPGWTPPATPATPATPPTAAAPPPPSRKALSGGLLAGLVASGAGVVLLLAALLFTTIRLHNADAVSSARSGATAAASSFATELLTYDYHHVDKDFGVVVDHATGTFKANFSKTSKDLKALITKYQVVSTGRVDATGVADASADRATVVVFADQTGRSTTSAQPHVDRTRLRLTLTHSSGAWLVEKVESL